MSTTYSAIGLEELEKKKGLLSFTPAIPEHQTQFIFTQPAMKSRQKETIIHDRGRRQKEKGKLF